MKQVIQSTRTGKLGLRDVPAPTVRAGHLVVHTRASLISAGTERLVVDFAKKSLPAKARARPDLVKKVMTKARRDGAAATMQAVLARLDEPLPLGYSAAGDVVAVGAGLEGRFRVSDRIAMAGAGLANHAELNVVPGALAAKVPDGVADEEACFATLAAIALHGVRNLGLGLGDVAAVIGAGLVGQLALQLLVLAGARVVVLDTDPKRLQLAQGLGAEATFDPTEVGLPDAIRALTGGRGCDGILIAAATESSQPFATAATVARDRARVAMVGLTGTAFPYREFMQKELSVVVSRSYGPGRYDDDFEGRGVKYPPGFVRWTESENLAESLRLMAPTQFRRLDVGALISHRFAIDDAEAAYALVLGENETRMGVVLTYPEATGETPPPAFAEPRVAKGRCVLGVIGAGNFARAVLLPQLKKLKGVELNTLVARRGAQAQDSGQTFGFAHASSDEAAVLDNPAVNAVVVATRHDSHAELTARALAAGKSVLVEKPLGLDRGQIEQVEAARYAADGFFQVGFNRRFAPLAVKLRQRLDEAVGPKFVLLRVNAGAVAASSWLHDPDEGGGRVLGEVCHFVDLARFLIGAQIVSVQADSAAVIDGTCDDVSVGLRFADGSLATIAYTALGDTASSKERIEAYAGGWVATVEDFRSLTIVEAGKEAKEGVRGPDKGFRAALGAFADAVAAGGPAPVDEAELIETSLATIAILESLQQGRRIDLPGS
ncbi:MAG: bi-domain-containing oxidoreductase [Rhodospirillales bacterium]|jgi:predicted dehydrogenase/threonine dehydrogenase-like Zn-dependent dehydrogenase|nr:bi-domain-containing oxidoreductase [Rhodospirillales bacterium]